MSTSTQPEDFEAVLKGLREAYWEKREGTNLHPPLRRPLIDRTVEKVDRYTFWYEGEEDAVRCLRIYDMPGSLSGNLLRLLQNLPAITTDCEIDGDVIRPLQNPPPPPEPLSDDSRDVSAELELLPTISNIGKEHFVKSPKYENEIFNLLKCQAGKCPGLPLSPNIVQLLGKSNDGKLVFPKYLTPISVVGPVHSICVYKSWILQLLRGVQTLHSVGIIHRDLRIDNIVFSQDRETLIICDLESQWGNRAAPEILHNSKLDAGWTQLSDIWDVGNCIKSLLYGNNPINSVVEWKIPPPFGRVVEACQRTVPHERAGVEELIEMVESI
ncbi:MAG: hypothetical protein M1820_000767 [Bogoriella megaspora]|nr:MAG: hypothetical protein M1820_000767 [Bogoriella megaspora]